MPTDDRDRERREKARAVIHRFAASEESDFTEWQVGLMIAFADRENAGLWKQVEDEVSRRNAYAMAASSELSDAQRIWAAREMKLRQQLAAAQSALSQIAALAVDPTDPSAELADRLYDVRRQLERIAELAKAEGRGEGGESGS